MQFKNQVDDTLNSNPLDHAPLAFDRSTTVPQVTLTQPEPGSTVAVVAGTLPLRFRIANWAAGDGNLFCLALRSRRRGKFGEHVDLSACAEREGSGDLISSSNNDGTVLIKFSGMEVAAEAESLIVAVQLVNVHTGFIFTPLQLFAFRPAVFGGDRGMVASDENPYPEIRLRWNESWAREQSSRAVTFASPRSGDQICGESVNVLVAIPPGAVSSSGSDLHACLFHREIIDDNDQTALAKMLGCMAAPWWSAGTSLSLPLGPGVHGLFVFLESSNLGPDGLTRTEDGTPLSSVYFQMHAPGKCPEAGTSFAAAVRDAESAGSVSLPASSRSALHAQLHGFVNPFEDMGGSFGSRHDRKSDDLTTAAQMLPQRMPDGALPVICEIGFNAGYSAVTFLVAHTTARVVSFDIGDFAVPYVAKRWIDEAFPERHQLVLGDSGITVRNWKDRCDLYFIDGGHEYLHVKRCSRPLLSPPSSYPPFVPDRSISCATASGTSSTSIAMPWPITRTGGRFSQTPWMGPWSSSMMPTSEAWPKP